MLITSRLSGSSVMLSDPDVHVHCQLAPQAPSHQPSCSHAVCSKEASHLLITVPHISAFPRGSAGAAPTDQSCIAVKTSWSQPQTPAAAHRHELFQSELCRLAYDGRGNFVVRSEADMASGVAKLGGFEAGLYAEAWVPFVKVWRLHTPSHPPSPLFFLPPALSGSLRSLA